MVDGLQLAATTELETALAAIEAAAPALAVIDSVQTLTSGELTGPAGSVGQVREVASRLAEAAKSAGTVVALVGHVTKEGTVAGPRTLEHLVDAVIYLEGERLGATRLLRAAKNRFGSTDEVGVLEMRGDGLAEVEDAEPLLPGVGRDAERRRRDHDRAGGDAAAGRRDPGAVSRRPATGRRAARPPASTSIACSCSSPCSPATPA